MTSLTLMYYLKYSLLMTHTRCTRFVDIVCIFIASRQSAPQSSQISQKKKHAQLRPCAISVAVSVGVSKRPRHVSSRSSPLHYSLPIQPTLCIQQQRPLWTCAIVFDSSLSNHSLSLCRRSSVVFAAVKGRAAVSDYGLGPQRRARGTLS